MISRRPPLARLLHVSDLHFGSPGVGERAEALLDAIRALAPDAVAVSGDLTRRATPAEFRAVRAFLDRIDAPTVVVPGNHDVPLAPWLRFRDRHARFVAHVGPDLAPYHLDGALAVAGIDTTRAFAIDGGRARRRAMASLVERFGAAPPRAYRVVVAHHPFTRQPGRRLALVAQRSGRALRAFDALAVDAVLTGHRHESVVTRATDVVRGARRPYLLLQAGTATTHRGRRSERGRSTFLCLDVGDREVRCARHAFDERDGFLEDRVEVHPRTGAGSRWGATPSVD
jgi:3',5'-cyclic AMP phosphodiesterase CpdA